MRARMTIKTSPITEVTGTVKMSGQARGTQGIQETPLRCVWRYATETVLHQMQVLYAEGGGPAVRKIQNTNVFRDDSGMMKQQQQIKKPQGAEPEKKEDEA